jgi:hypothetical protein
MVNIFQLDVVSSLQPGGGSNAKNEVDPFQLSSLLIYYNKAGNYNKVVVVAMVRGMVHTWCALKQQHMARAVNNSYYKHSRCNNITKLMQNHGLGKVKQVSAFTVWFY